jgi:glycine cleavage system H lipoate-binding protein
MLDDQDLAQIPATPRLKFASGYKVADGYYYHMGHSWVRLEHGGYAKIGMDDFMVRLFGEFQDVALPSIGTKIKQNESGWVFSRDGHTASVLSPMTGKVLAVNNKTKEHPELAHKDPYKDGWLFVIEPIALKKGLRPLYYGDDSVRWMEKESQKLVSLMGSEYEKLAATGGEPIDDVYHYFPEIGWDQLAKTFLRTEIA